MKELYMKQIVTWVTRKTKILAPRPVLLWLGLLMGTFFCMPMKTAQAQFIDVIPDNLILETGQQGQTDITVPAFLTCNLNLVSQDPSIATVVPQLLPGVSGTTETITVTGVDVGNTVVEIQGNCAPVAGGFPAPIVTAKIARS